jgi:hypothetical protein
MRKHNQLIFTFSAIVIILAGSLPFGGGRSAAWDSPGIELALDTAVPNQDGLLVLYGAQRLGGEIGMPVAAGDINGDGRADVVFCEMFASAGAGSRVNNGQVNFYLSDGRDSGTVDAATQPANISILVGQSSGDLLGSAVAIGDVNGDGFGDVIVSASLNDGPGGSRFNAGSVYIVPGSANFHLNADLQTADGTPPAGITVIYGPQVNGRFGIWVDTGDLNGDGIPDIIVGADQLDSSAGTHVGGAYVIFGSHSLPHVIDLASPPAGVQITRIIGVNQQDHWGACVHANDLNGDGIADLVISAALDRDSGSYISPDDQSNGENFKGAGAEIGRPGCGEVYVLYGSHNWPAQIDLHQPPAGSTHIIGANTGDLMGSQLFSADVNGDGKTDLILGAIQALAPDNMGRTGAVFVIYGAAGLAGATIDLVAPAPQGINVTAIYGQDNLDCAGDSVRAYDINRDGRADLFIGSPSHTFTVNGETRDEAGDTTLIFGQPGFLPPVIKLYDLPMGVRAFRLAGAHGDEQGVNGGDEFSYRLAGADVDGDGFVDYVANAMKGDGAGNRIVDAGNVYIFSGRKLSAKLGMLGSTPITPVINAAVLKNNVGQTVQQADAGQAGLQVVLQGTGLDANTQVFINNKAVVFNIAVDTPGVLIVNLDANPTIRNAAGPLAVTAQNAGTAMSNAVLAGTLIGPQISMVKPRRKPSGLLILKISGSGFKDSATVTVVDAAGQQVAVRSVSFIESDFLQARVEGDTVSSGATLRLRVVNAGGIQSNEASIVAP